MTDEHLGGEEYRVKDIEIDYFDDEGNCKTTWLTIYVEIGNNGEILNVRW